MRVCVAEVDLIDHEAQGEGPGLAEEVVLVPDVHVLHVHLNPIEERREQRSSNRRIELVVAFVLLRFQFFDPCLSLLLGLLLLYLLALSLLFQELLRFFCITGLLAPDPLVHGCDVVDGIVDIVTRINVPGVVL